MKTLHRIHGFTLVIVCFAKLQVHAYFDPHVGRFASRDPIQENGGVNLYGFVANDPIRGVDYLGFALYAFDGTGMNGTGEPDERKLSWVFLLQRDYEGKKRYYPGVGSSVETAAIGGLTGLGGQIRLEEAYRDFLRNYRNNDRDIDIIGFSRGAALARAFANLIYERGDGSGEYSSTTSIGKGSTITRTYYGKPCYIPKIRFVGLFDTVGSFGIPGNHANIGYKLGLPLNVEVARQAVAKDEKRFLFPLTPLGSGVSGQDFDEEYFPGDHSDIGHGHGLASNNLSYAPLLYIWRGGIGAGVPFGALPDFTFTESTSPHDLSQHFPHNIFPKRPR